MPTEQKRERTRTSPHDELVELHEDFEQSGSPTQRAARRITAYLAAPINAILVAIAAAIWAITNTVLGRHALDPPPFAGLETFATVAAFIATILILAGQKHEDEAARRRGRLTLHLAAESEQKIAKLIALLEEQRRDSAAIHDRHDPEAEEMASPAEPKELLDRLEQPKPELP